MNVTLPGQKKHRGAELGRQLSNHSPSHQGHPQQGAQLMLSNFSASPRKRFCRLCLTSAHAPSSLQPKPVLPAVWTVHPVFLSVPLASCSTTGHHWRAVNGRTVHFRRWSDGSTAWHESCTFSTLRLKKKHE